MISVHRFSQRVCLSFCSVICSCNQIARDEEDLDKQIRYGALWAIDDILEELQLFCEKLAEMIH